MLQFSALWEFCSDTVITFSAKIAGPRKKGSWLILSHMQLGFSVDGSRNTSYEEYLVCPELNPPITGMCFIVTHREFHCGQLPTTASQVLGLFLQVSNPPFLLIDCSYHPKWSFLTPNSPFVMTSKDVCCSCVCGILRMVVCTFYRFGKCRWKDLSYLSKGQKWKHVHYNSIYCHPL